MKERCFRGTLGVLAAACSLSATSAFGDMFINEIYFDPPGSSIELISEYVELRGDPNTSLVDHYLVFLENESSATANPGEIDYIFDLGSLSTPKLGSNGYLRLRQAGNPYPAAASGTTDLVNTGTSFAWGANGASTVGWSGEGGKDRIENSGFTAMLIKNNGGAGSAPFVPLDPNTSLVDLDADDDNELDAGSIYADWEVFDSIGINSEASDIDGFLYAPINFSAGTPGGGGNVPAGAMFVDVGYEIEYIGRWGDSTGSTQSDWHASNLTNDGAAGFDGPADYRQSGDPHGIGAANQFVETSQGVPYGSLMVGSPGAPNPYILDGDYDPVYDGEEFVFNGVVDGRDFLAWQRNFGFGGGLYATRQHGDGDLDRTVGPGDLDVWEANYTSALALVTAATSVPEPCSVLLLGLAMAMQLSSRRF